MTAGGDCCDDDNNNNKDENDNNAPVTPNGSSLLRDMDLTAAVPAATDAEAIAIEEENRNLRLKLQIIRERRRHVAQLSQETKAMVSHSRRVENQAVLERTQAFQAYQSAHSKRRQIERWLDVAQKWNVTDDCFHIWYEGDFGTINNLRLGCESRRGAPQQQQLHENDSLNGTKQATVSNGGTPWYSYQQSTVDSTPAVKLLGSPSLSSAVAPTTTTIKVPWNEINSALGLVALLLSSLENRPQSYIKFQHEILPMGSTSKIKITASTTTTSSSSSTMYQLYSDDRFHFFGKRNFNMALNCLLQCLADAAEEIQKRDRTMSLPHPIIPKSGEWTIGGLSISYGLDGEQWTKAMKYFLTNVKWCVAYLARHVDR